MGFFFVYSFSAPSATASSLSFTHSLFPAFSCVIVNSPYLRLSLCHRPPLSECLSQLIDHSLFSIISLILPPPSLLPALSPFARSLSSPFVPTRISLSFSSSFPFPLVPPLFVSLPFSLFLSLSSLLLSHTLPFPLSTLPIPPLPPLAPRALLTLACLPIPTRRSGCVLCFAIQRQGPSGSASPP